MKTLVTMMTLALGLVATQAQAELICKVTNIGRPKAAKQYLKHLADGQAPTNQVDATVEGIHYRATYMESGDGRGDLLAVEIALQDGQGTAIKTMAPFPGFASFRVVQYGLDVVLSCSETTSAYCQQFTSCREK